MSTTPVEETNEKRVSLWDLKEIGVAGFKSIRDLQTVRLAPLTILAGANSSGKSSIMQPLLLLKQTLEATFDPGPLLLSGENVKFSSPEQILSRFQAFPSIDSFEVRLGLLLGCGVFCFKAQKGKGFVIESQKFNPPKGSKEPAITFEPDMTSERVDPLIPKHVRDLLEKEARRRNEKLSWEIIRDRFLLYAAPRTKDSQLDYRLSPLHPVQFSIMRLIHLRGNRGNPERSYSVTAVGSTFPGDFQNYTASVISKWQQDQNKEKLNSVGQDLRELGLTWKVEAERINDVQVRLKVGRLPRAKRGGRSDLVDISDVGFGVSQSLPVVVALHVAKPGQPVYLEQPEIHLHPRAQVALARVLVDAAKRGVKVVAETHSRLLLLGVQTLVAKEGLKDLVALHWFQRNEEGATSVHTAELDSLGRYGPDWPEDFDDVSLRAESEYLDILDNQLGSS